MQRISNERLLELSREPITATMIEVINLIEEVAEKRLYEITVDVIPEHKVEDKKKIMTECYGCKHRRDVPGNCHIQCVKPDARMTGDQHGIKKGWFMYPILFDPTWKTKLCSNFEPISAVSLSVSGAVSDQT